MPRSYQLVLLSGILLCFCSCGPNHVELELDKFKAEGKPVDLKEFGLLQGGQESPEWQKVVSACANSKKDGQYKELAKLKILGFQYRSPGLAENVTRQTRIRTATGNSELAWGEIDSRAGNLRTALSELPLLPPNQSTLFIPDYYEGVDAKIPNATECLDLIKNLSLLITIDTASGRYDEALFLLEQAIRYNRAMTSKTTLIEGLVEATCDVLLTACSWNLLQHSELSAAQLSRLQSIVETPMTESDVLHIFQGERLVMSQSLMKLRNPGQKKKTPASTPVMELKRLQNLWLLKKWFDFDLGTWLSFQHANENALEKWIEKGDYSPVKAQARKQKEFLENLGTFEKYRYLLTKMALPATENALDKFAAGMTQQRMLQVAVALKRFYLEKGFYPDSLIQLVPDYLPFLPKDPITGGSFFYLLERDGDYTLYGVGINGVDDGGNAIEIKTSPKPKWNWDLAYDIVWPREKKP